MYVCMYVCICMCVCLCVCVCMCVCVDVCMYVGASALVQGLSLRDALDTLLEARSAAVIRRFFIFYFLFLSFSWRDALDTSLALETR